MKAHVLHTKLKMIAARSKPATKKHAKSLNSNFNKVTFFDI